MVGAGPFTFRNSLGYQGLIDLLALAKKDKPQVLILLGPFVDMNNAEINTGDLYVSQGTGKAYVTYEELFKDIISTVQRELKDQKTKVVLVPSYKDINHCQPLPQVPFSEGISANFIVAPNPCELVINDVTFAIINTDIVKDMCPNIFAKNMDPAKIDLSLMALHE